MRRRMCLTKDKWLVMSRYKWVWATPLVVHEFYFSVLEIMFHVKHFMRR